MSNHETGATRMIAKLEADGFQRTEHGPIAVLHHREFRLSRFGVVDTVFGIGLFDGRATAADFWAHDALVHEAARKVKSRWPLGLGGSIEMFPVLFTASADDDAISAAQQKAPTRWSTMSAHALVHGDPPLTALFEGKALWGAAYIKSQRTKLRSYLP